MKGRGKKQPVKTDAIAAGLQQRLQNGEPLSANMLAVSRAGHDKDVLYVVLAQEGSYLWLADGKRRSLASPKKKKQMHVQLITHLPESLLEQMHEIRLDAHLKKIIKSYELRMDQKPDAE